MWCALILFSFLIVKPIDCANILIVNDLSSPSVQIWNAVYAVDGLVKNGHNVTMISTHVSKGLNYTNLHQLHFEGVYEKLYAEMDDTFSFDYVWENINLFFFYGTRTCSLVSETKGLQQLLDYPSDFKFDLIVFELTIGNGCLYPLIQRFNYPPTIGITSFLLPSFVSHIFGNHLHPSYLPFYHYEFDTEMSFFERVRNTIFVYYDVFSRNFYEYPLVEKIHKKRFGKNVDPLKKLERHMSLALINTSPILGISQPLTPNLIPIGGLQVKPAKPLPSDLESILNSSEKGVVLFSMGTNVRSDKLDVNLRKQILDAFASLPFTFIWKFESELETPKNVIVRKWLPINDILAHKNVVLFISHGGALSTHETMYHGVPVLGIPVFADQFLNVRLMVKRKIATSLSLDRITTDNLRNMIMETVSNPIYGKNMKDVSRRFRDLPQTPLEIAIQWSEYAMNHEGAQFLNTPARDLPFFVSNGLDVMGFFILIVIFTALTICNIIKKVCSCMSLNSKIKKE